MNYHQFPYDKVDNVYYNAEIINEAANKEQKLAIFNETRQIPMINTNADNYYFTVVRLNIPVTTIPIFYYQLRDPADITAGDPGDGIYSVTLTYGGSNYQQHLLYTERSFGTTSDPYTIYQYQHFIDIINTAFQSSYDAMITANGGVGGALDLALSQTAPFITYDSNTSLLTLHVKKAYEPSDQDVGIFMNWSLYNLFQSFDIKFYGYNTQADGLDVNILVKDNHNNEDPDDSDSYVFIQEFQTLYLWYDLRKFLLF